MADPRDEYVFHELLYSQESLLKYVPGGYHPIVLHDLLKDGQYKIYRKLGWGGYSTVWLARDRKYHRWVAVKILTANSSETGREVEILRSLSDALKDNGSVGWFNPLLDSFTVHGHNGVHTCLVFEVLGPTLASVMELANSGRYKIGSCLILRAAQQLLQAVDALHQSGFIHGDLNAHNIAFRWMPSSKLDAQDIIDAFQGVRKHKPIRHDGEWISPHMPGEIIEAVIWRAPFQISNPELCLFDFGLAFSIGKEPTGSLEASLGNAERAVMDMLEITSNLSYVSQTLSCHAVNSVDMLVSAKATTELSQID